MKFPSTFLFEATYPFPSFFNCLKQKSVVFLYKLRPIGDLHLFCIDIKHIIHLNNNNGIKRRTRMCICRSHPCWWWCCNHGKQKSRLSTFIFIFRIYTAAETCDLQSKHKAIIHILTLLLFYSVFCNNAVIKLKE